MWAQMNPLKKILEENLIKVAIKDLKVSNDISQYFWKFQSISLSKSTENKVSSKYAITTKPTQINSNKHLKVC